MSRPGQVLTARELAELVIEVLDAQRKYFKSRAREDLIESKKLEAVLRSHAEATRTGFVHDKACEVDCRYEYGMHCGCPCHVTKVQDVYLISQRRPGETDEEWAKRCAVIKNVRMP